MHYIFRIYLVLYIQQQRCIRQMDHSAEEYILFFVIYTCLKKTAASLFNNVLHFVCCFFIAPDFISPHYWYTNTAWLPSSSSLSPSTLPTLPAPYRHDPKTLWNGRLMYLEADLKKRLHGDDSVMVQIQLLLGACARLPNVNPPPADVTRTGQGRHGRRSYVTEYIAVFFHVGRHNGRTKEKTTSKRNI